MKKTRRDKNKIKSDMRTHEKENDKENVKRELHLPAMKTNK
jgi:hypothetical protein